MDHIGNYTIKIHGKPIKTETLTKLHFPNILTTININNVLKTLQQSVICCGNEDFDDLVSKKLGDLNDFQFLSIDNTVTSHLETSDGKTMSDMKIIRHENCDILIDSSKGLENIFFLFL